MDVIWRPDVLTNWFSQRGLSEVEPFAERGATEKLDLVYCSLRGVLLKI